MEKKQINKIKNQIKNMKMYHYNNDSTTYEWEPSLSERDNRNTLENLWSESLVDFISNAASQGSNDVEYVFDMLHPLVEEFEVRYNLKFQIVLKILIFEIIAEDMV